MGTHLSEKRCHLPVPVGGPIETVEGRVLILVWDLPGSFTDGQIGRVQRQDDDAEWRW